MLPWAKRQGIATLSQPPSFFITLPSSIRARLITIRSSTRSGGLGLVKLVRSDALSFYRPKVSIVIADLADVHKHALFNKFLQLFGVYNVKAYIGELYATAFSTTAEDIIIQGRFPRY